MAAGERRVGVSLGARSYDVVIAPSFTGLRAALAAVSSSSKVAVVTDDAVAPLWLEALRAELAGLTLLVIAFPHGEANKHQTTWWGIVDRLLTEGVDRSTPILALGGGVAGDMAGFAAASLLRGLTFVQVPTTLLAMVDSSVGGKTGFNHPRGKNLIGAFHQPSLVWAAMETLSTLPIREVRAGLAEVVKTALIGDAELLRRMEADVVRLARGDVDALAAVVERCVQIKAMVVGEDEREEGRRAVLNLGHTVGHAVEAAGGYGVLLHGEAVGIGLIAEAEWAVREGICLEGDLPERLRRLLAGLGLPTEVPATDRDALVAAMGVDKKRRGAKITLPVPVRSGEVTLVALPVERAAELLPT